jgi:hypothetical protein
MRVHGVLDRQLVQAELARDRLELLGCRFEQADPDERALAVALVEDVLQLQHAIAALSVLVDGAVDDHRFRSSRSLRASASASSRVLTWPV